MAVRMELARILIRELNDYQLIELREVAPNQNPEDEPGKQSFSQVEGGRSFPIVIGLPEAQAIERRLKGIVVKRPQTHDLMSNILTELGAKLESITINDLVDHTFYAQLNVRDSTGKQRNIDARPSDAIAMGIANNVPILVAEHVLESAQSDMP